MRRFTPPATAPPTPASVLLTRPIYAQLRHQTFSPPKPFRSWFDPAVVAEGSDEWRRREVGMKISVGFEMAFDADKHGFAVEVEDAIRSADGDRGTGEGGEEDGEEWLTVSSAQLDDLMSSKAGLPQAQREEEATRSEAEKMKAFAAQMESFVSGKGDFEGATLDDDMSSDGDDDDDDDSEQDDLNADLDMLDDEGKSAKGKAGEKERKRRMDGLVKGLGEGEWGAQTRAKERPVNGVHSDQPHPKPPARGQGEVEMVDAEIGSSEAKSSAAARAKEVQTVEGISKSRLARPSYDGYVSESSDDGDDEGEDQQGAREAIRDAFGGGEGGEEAGDVDMGEEEDEFLAFARDALGLTEEQYEAILESRREKGAYVPATSKKASAAATTEDANRRQSKGKAVRFTEASEPHAIPPPSHARPSQPAASGAKGPNFASFDRLMSQMDDELKKSSARGGPVRPSGPDLGHDDGDDSDEDGDDGATFDEAMDAELADLMKSSTGGVQGPRDYELVKNFLESFKAQAGMSGPVSGLAGLMGVDLPAWKE